jgi:hypothetical protein
MKKLEEIKSELQLYASFYSKLGINLTRISEWPNNSTEEPLKSPDHEWNKYKFFIQEESEFNSLFNLSQGYYGLGSVLGFKKIRVIDIDGCNDIQLIKQFLEVLGLPINYRWVVRSGSNNGFHIYIRCLQHEFSAPYGVPKAFQAKNQYSFKTIELIWQGHSVLPPSIHSNETKKILDNRLENENLDIEYYYSFLNGRPNQLPNEISVSSIDDLVENFCDPEIIEGASNISLDYGTKLVSKNSSLIFDSIKYLSRKPLYLFFDLKFENPGFDGVCLRTPDDNFVRFSEYIQKQLLVSGSWRLLKWGGELIETCSYFVGNYPEYGRIYGPQDLDYVEEKLAESFGVSITEFLILVQNRINVVDYLVFFNKVDYESIRKEFIKYGLFFKEVDPSKILIIQELFDDASDNSNALKVISKYFDVNYDENMPSNTVLEAISSYFWRNYVEFR